MMAEPSWTPTEQADAATCAALLHTGLCWWILAVSTGLVLGIVAVQRGCWLACLAAWGGGLLSTWLAVRVRLDAALFARMAQGVADVLPTPSVLDGALGRVLKVPARGATRPMGARIQGALRLYRALVGMSLVQGLVLLWLVLGQVRAHAP